jgi:hypothetical protein
MHRTEGAYNVGQKLNLLERKSLKSLDSSFGSPGLGRRRIYLCKKSVAGKIFNQ